MKIRVFTLLFIMFSITTVAQIGIGTSTPNPSAELDVFSTTKGFLMPRMTQVQRLAILTPATGLMVYQNDGAQGIYYYNGTVWVQNNGTAAWTLTGNTGILATNYLGTSDAQSLSIRTNAVDRIRILGSTVPATAGFIGIGTVTPTNKLHLFSATAGAFRLQDGTQLAGRILTSDANGVATWTTPVVGASTAWSRTGNAAVAGDFIGTTNSQDFSIRTNNTEKVRVLVNGNVGINVVTPTAKLDVAESQINLPIIRGTNNNNTANSISQGVLGVAFSTGIGSAGIVGSSNLASSAEIGVLGDYNFYGAAVYGKGKGAIITNDLFDTFSGRRDYGVYGSVGTDFGTGVYGKNSSIGANAYGVYCNGNFAVTGTKSASVPTTKGNQLVYCTESPELWFEDLGFAKLSNGEARVVFDEMFLETVHIDDAHKTHVFLQEQGDSNGLIVTINADHKGFTVKEKKGGRSNIDFSYRILAKRRFYQDQRFGVDANQPLENNLIKHKDVPVSSTDPTEVQRKLEIFKTAKFTEYNLSKDIKH